MSESEAAGRLTRMPGIVDAAAIMPVKSVGVPRLMAKGLRTGFLDIVELRMAKAPVVQRTQKYLSLAIFPSFNGNQPLRFWVSDILLFAFNHL